MDIIINSLYSNKDVFLRELVSNAADACDKKRFLSLTEGGASGDDEDLGIKVYANREANTLTIEDSGIGMSLADLKQNLGRIAESGTKRFMENLDASKKDDVSLIGQFGVGFYSGFLVADKMTVQTRRADEENKQWRWEASMENLESYTIAEEENPGDDTISGSGTRITLHLKEESDQYLDDVALRTLIEKYSEFVQFPIQLQRVTSKPVQEPDLSQPVPESGEVPMKTTMKKEKDWQQINTKKPLWLRPARQVEQDEYNAFYKATFGAWDEPAAQTHFSIEGNVDFKALLYLPSEVPYELTRDMFAAEARSIRLYVKRVFINDKFEELIPRWLTFIRGVVDSNDLPLNVGREILQQSRSLRLIRQRLVKKTVDMMSDLAKTNETRYDKFWKNFGRYIKVGMIEDDKVKDDLVPLYRFYSSQSGEKTTDFESYVSRMPEDQKNIYYVVGETRAQAAASPALEKIKSKGFEVMYLWEAIDEMALQNIQTFQEKSIVDVGKEQSGADEMSEEEKDSQRKANDDLEKVRAAMKTVIGDRITKVEVSTRLVESPATLVQSEYGVSPNMQKYLRAQAAQDTDQEADFAGIFNQAVLEINPEHPIIVALREAVEQGDEANPSDEVRQKTELLFNTATLAAGYMLDNNAEYAKMVTQLMTQAAGK